MDAVILTYSLRRCTAYVDARLGFGPVLPWLQQSDQRQVVFFFFSCSQTPGFFSSRFWAGLIPPTGTLFPNSKFFWAVSYFWKLKIQNVPPISCFHWVISCSWEQKTRPELCQFTMLCKCYITWLLRVFFAFFWSTANWPQLEAGHGAGCVGAPAGVSNLSGA